MLSAWQAQVVAVVTDGSIICLDCAEKERPGLRELLAAGLYEFMPEDWSALTRYELDEYQGEYLWELAIELVDERLMGRWPELRDKLIERKYEQLSEIDYSCDDCGEGIS